jgi:hydroxyacylglutathione hydrolase
MRSRVKRTLIVAALILIPLIAFLGTRIYRIKSDFNKMNAAATGQVADIVYAVKDSYVNLYLVKDGDRYIAFDSGTATERIRGELEKLGIDPAAVAAVFLTHGDSDHTGGLGLFPDAVVCLGNLEEQMVDGRKARFLIFKNKLARKHVLLADNETVRIGGLTVTVLSTPGHTPGSVCYLVNGEYLFTGDSMSLKAGKADIFSRTINMDSETQAESLKKVATLTGVKAIFTAHHGISDSFDSALAPFRK